VRKCDTVFCLGGDFSHSLDGEIFLFRTLEELTLSKMEAETHLDYGLDQMTELLKFLDIHDAPSFRNWSLFNHPDRGGSHDKFVLVIEAYKKHIDCGDRGKTLASESTTPEIPKMSLQQAVYAAFCTVQPSRTTAKKKRGEGSETHRR
jgi:hypothetical protein